MIAAILVAKERHRIRKHPYIAATAIVIRFRPSAILVLNGQRIVLDAFLRAIRIQMESCKRQEEKRSFNNIAYFFDCILSSPAIIDKSIIVSSHSCLLQLWLDLLEFSDC